MDCNQVVLCGRVAEIGALRYSPAGVAILEFRLSHASEQAEAGLKRRVECEVGAVALAEQARTAARLKPGTPVRLTGFLAAKSRNSTQLVMHVNRIETE
ncbi:MAG: primosomal replication protein N [Betaproteobacteria bacterium]|nr:primosomal replication protein N [Betaproteobacteria bacterium]